MSLYSVGVLTTNTTTSEPAAEVLAGSGDRSRLVEMMLAETTNTPATSFGLGRPAAVGTPSTSVTVLAEHSSDSVGRTTLATAWSSKPTAPSAYFRRVFFWAGYAQLAVWVFPRGLVIPASGSVVVWNLVASQVIAVNITVEE